MTRLALERCACCGSERRAIHWSNAAGARTCLDCHLDADARNAQPQAMPVAPPEAPPVGTAFITDSELDEIFGARP